MRVLQASREDSCSNADWEMVEEKKSPTGSGPEAKITLYSSKSSKGGSRVGTCCTRLSGP